MCVSAADQHQVHGRKSDTNLSNTQCTWSPGSLHLLFPLQTLSCWANAGTAPGIHLALLCASLTETLIHIGDGAATATFSTSCWCLFTLTAKVEPIMILAAGTDYRRCCIQTACPSSLLMTLGLAPAPSCRQKPVPLGHSGEEEETGVRVSALSSLYPWVLPDVPTPAVRAGMGFLFLPGFTGSFKTRIFFLE